MTIPIVYRNKGERTIISYDYADITDGTGVVVFDGFGSAASTYKLTTSTVKGNPDIVEGTTANLSSSWLDAFTANFDLTPFNTPRIIKGTAIWEFSVNYTSNVSGGSEGQAQTTLTLQHHDGNSNYTDIGTATSAAVGMTAGSGSYTYALTADLTETHFKAGENLRIVVKGQGRRASGPQADLQVTVKFPFDPTNSDVTPFTAADNHTYFKLHTPFKLDL